MITEETKKNIIEKLGIEGLPLEKAEAVMAKLEQNIERKLTLEVLDLLSIEDQQEFIKISEKENIEDIKSFLKLKIPNLDSLTRAVSESVVKEFKNLTTL